MNAQGKKLWPLSLGAIGIVYGDLGTSPLYAFRESLHGLAITTENVLGILSLIFWSLFLIISIKYIVYVLRADNHGEGGVLALLALIKKKNHNAFNLFLGMSLFGTALLIGDGMLTPAISVVSAIEGLKVVSPAFSYLVLPLSMGILLVLYLCQHFGTAKIASFFGPILLIWFITIAILGVVHIFDSPIIFNAINPVHGVNFFIENGWKGYILLGGVFLVVTGGEALYADLGHFGKGPIRLSWYTIVFPSLLCSYFGQGAYLLKHPEAIANPFYALAPSWFSYPLLILATVATIIASQAVISATFSLAKQAILLDLYPRVNVVQTSEDEMGHVYVPHMNRILALGTLSFVLVFKSSSAMAYAYGIAVNLVMLTVSFLLLYVAYKIWRWSLLKIITVFALFLPLELGFLGANLHKILYGGWVTIAFAIICSAVMITWYQGIKYLRSSYYTEGEDFKDTIAEFAARDIYLLPKLQSIFIADPYDKRCNGLVSYFTLNRMMPEFTLIVSIQIENYPYVTMDNRYELIKFGENIHRLVLHVGFMQLVDIPQALFFANEMKVFSTPIDLNQAIFLVEMTQISPTLSKTTLPFFWQEKLFSFLMRNSALDIEFYGLPYGRTIAVGSYCEI